MELIMKLIFAGIASWAMIEAVEWLFTRHVRACREMRYRRLAGDGMRLAGRLLEAAQDWQTRYHLEVTLRLLEECLKKKRAGAPATCCLASLRSFRRWHGRVDSALESGLKQLEMDISEMALIELLRMDREVSIRIGEYRQQRNEWRKQ